MPEIKSHSIEYEGMTVTQCSNGHIWINKDGMNVAHFNVDKYRTDDELVEYVEFYNQLIEYSSIAYDNADDQEDEDA